MYRIKDSINKSIIRKVVFLCLLFGSFAVARPALDFKQAKTIFQTNCGYDPRLAIAVDGVMVHRHGGRFEGELKSWLEKDFTVGRMFFADSDAANAYWTGKWDGAKHDQDVERNQAGDVVKCANVRPYMLPTDGWIRYLEQMVDKSLAAGAVAILPEEPLAHVFTGYEQSFRELWAKRYGAPWQPQHTSAEARFLTAQLKNELYIKLEQQLSQKTRQSAKAAAGDVPFILPIHSIYSNIAAQLVAPLGTSAYLPDVDGYIGQIWTGPVNWALGCYDSPRKSFFTSAYVLYDYFTQLTVESDKKLWLLVDPVEDNPNHKWSEFAQWYKHCIAAMLLMDDVDSYEIMPWPDRIFLPNYGTGGGTPAPEDYRVTILAVTQVLQEIPKGGDSFVKSWPAGSGDVVAGGRIGIAMADTLMWQRHDHPMLQGVYSMFLPLLERGVPVSSFLLERAKDQAYLDRFKLIVLSYEDFKPVDPSMNEALADWVNSGSVLLVLGSDGDELDECPNFWWRKAGFASPLKHLLSMLKTPAGNQTEWKHGDGWVLRNPISPAQFAKPSVAEKEYLPLLRRALAKTGQQLLKTPGSFCMQRGPFVIAHAETDSVTLSGKLIDIFDPKLALKDKVELSPGHSGLYRDVSSEIRSRKPALLHATHRLMSCEIREGGLSFTIRGPAQTPAVVRIYTPVPESAKIKASKSDGGDVQIERIDEADTILLRFPNAPEGVSITIK